MKIIFNGEELELQKSLSLLDFIKAQGLPIDGTACAVNENIIPKSKWQDFILQENMQLDVFTLVAGG